MAGGRAAAPVVAICGCGWLGQPLAECLRQQHYTVKGSTTQESRRSKMSRQGIAAYQIEISPTRVSGDLAAFLDADILVLTLPFRRNFSDPRLYQHQISQLLQTQATTGRIRKILFTSSTSIYTGKGDVTEDDATDEPSPLRSRVLWQVEQMLLQQPNIAATVLRLAGLYGPGRPIGKSWDGKQPVANPRRVMNLVHQDDVVAVIQEIIRGNIGNEIFNVCADHHPARGELYTRVAAQRGLPAPDFEPDAGETGKRVSNQKLKARLGYEFLHPDPLQDIAAGRS